MGNIHIRQGTFTWGGEHSHRAGIPKNLAGNNYTCITLKCQSMLSLLDTRKWHVIANSTLQPPIVHLGNVHLKRGEFISMIITPPTTTTLPTSPSTLSDEEFNQFAMDKPIHISAGNEFDELTWRISPLCPSQTTYQLLME